MQAKKPIHLLAFDYLYFISTGDQKKSLKTGMGLYKDVMENEVPV